METGWKNTNRCRIFGYNKHNNVNEIDVFVSTMDVTGEIYSNSTIYKELIVH